MEKINNNNKSNSIEFQGKDFDDVVKIILFSFLGIIIYFIPIKINNQFETIIYHLSYYIENKISPIIEISLIFFVILSTVKIMINKENTFFYKISILIRVISLIILISFVLGKEEVFISDDKFLLIMRDLMRNLIILLPVFSIFMPLLIDYGLIEIIEAYTNKFMKRTFKVSGKVLLNILVYFFIDTSCGAYLTYRLYKDGKLREKEACITILSFSVLSLSLTRDLCDKLDINRWKFILLEILLVSVITIIISRIYPLKKKKQSYYVKVGYKDINCKKNRFKVALKRRICRGHKKNIISYSISYLNDLIYILMDIVPNIIFIFFISNFVYNTPYIINQINQFFELIITLLHLPNKEIISTISNINLFNNVLAIKYLNEDIFYFTRIFLSLIIAIQGISISFLIPFINKSVLSLNIKEIILVYVEKYALILFFCAIIYYVYINYIL